MRNRKGNAWFLGMSILLLASCSSSGPVYFPPAPTPPPSTAIVSKPYVDKNTGVYICPVPLKYVDPKNTNLPQWATKPQIYSWQLCDKYGVTAYTVGQTLHVIMPANVIFSTNDSNITYRGRPMLNELVRLMALYNTSIAIRVYADGVMPDSEAMDSTKARAEALQTYFWGHGINHQRLNAVGLGNTAPIANPHSAVGRAANQRVEVSFLIA